MKIHQLIFALTATLAFSVFQSCSKSETNDLQEAQYCLNKATAGQAKACVTSIASNVSAYSSSLKCAAIFISEGYGSAASLATSVDTLKNPSGCGGGCSATVDAAAAFNFHSSGVTIPNSTDLATASEAFSLCNASGVKFYAQISSLFQLGTLTANIAGTATPTGLQVEAALAATDSATLGNLVITTYAAVCTDTAKASDATKAYCAELASTLAKSPTSSAVDIGACLKKLLATPGSTCP